MQGADEYVSIPLDKGRLALFALLSIVLVASSAWLYLNPDQGRYDTGFLEWIALAGIALFGFGGVFCLTKLFDDRPGLILDHLGLIDNSSTVEAGRIVWSEIRDIKVYAVRHRRFLVLVIGNPERYFARGNLIAQFIARANHRLIGSPIAISSAVLDIGFTELEQRIGQFRSRFRAGNGTGLPARATNAPQFGKVRPARSRVSAPARRDWPTVGECLEYLAQWMQLFRGGSDHTKPDTVPLWTRKLRADANESVITSPAEPSTSSQAPADEITDEIT